MENEFCQIPALASEWSEYELLDSGDRLKLERFGQVVVERSEPKAWWRKSRPEIWKKADCRYIDSDKSNPRWEFFREIFPPVLDFNGIKFATKFMGGSKHLGVFPEQKPHWEFIRSEIKKRIAVPGNPIKPPKILNLFGYTGAATLVAVKEGASVTHVDASRPSVEWARKNQAASSLGDYPVRWIVEDALKFARRAARRGDFYDAIILDPPAFGRGPKNELWKLEKMLPLLLEECSAILSESPIFILMTIYNLEASSIMASNMLKQFFPKAGKIEGGELLLKPLRAGNPLPMSIWARAVF